MRSSLVLAAALLSLSATPAAARACSWQAAWASAQMTPQGENVLPANALRDATLRQVVRPSIGGARVRVRFSNAYGRAPLHVAAASIARSADLASARVTPGSVRALSFGGAREVIVPPGAEWWSDAVALPITAFDDLAVSAYFPVAPDGQTSHPGSRATSWIAKGEATGAADLTGATKTDHWFQLSGIEVERCAAPNGVVAFGDSITDGYGVKPNTNARWTDVLARRLGGKAAVLNLGIGGNRVLLDGLGPNAMARFDRDVLGQAGAKHLIVLEGVNDIGVLTGEQPATPEAHRALVAGVTGAYAQMVARAHAKGMTVHLATIMPFATNAYYHPGAASEADRQAINAWIRTPGNADRVIDFDRLMRDPARPDRLLPAYDSGDGLHPSIAGYRAMAEGISLASLR
ncbi:MAG: SGNH/GDSL hydrolase family protein [Sphingomonas phyllosphaerae]|uniref:SGNH/GDSL hydrolase family protein n=1 Tax=Sphingomonas phyllosphaerae TaxID=257003 RepID=UPI002FF5646B